ncbi:MAG: NAD(P)-dependent oxidoreductase [Planctomycetaceae bacterium]
MSESTQVGVIGLGLMGTALSERLLELGFQPVVWNRSPQKAAPLLQSGAVWSDNPLQDCERVIVSLFNSDAVTEVLTKMLPDATRCRTIIDTTTCAPEMAELTERHLHSLKIGYLEAPISGSSVQTRNGEALVISAGDSEQERQCEDLWPVLGAKRIHAGRVGSASRMKLVSNLVLGLNRAALAEGLGLAESLGLDLPATLTMLQQSAAASTVMHTKGNRMIEGDFTPQARLSQHRKDVGILLELAKQYSINLPLSICHDELLAQAETLGYGNSDNSAIAAVYRSFSSAAKP